MKLVGSVVGLCALAFLAGCGPFSTSSSTPPVTLVPLPDAYAAPATGACSGYTTYGVPRVAPLDTHKSYTALIDTNKGVVTVKLLPSVAPTAVQSFIFLAQHNFFNNVTFHRVIPGFMIQGGDPTGTGQCGPGYQFNDEKISLSYKRGIVAMANAGPNTNGSQFFIMLAANPLPANYIIFGKVTAGMSAVDKIASVPLGPSGGGEQSAPLQKVFMKSVRIVIS